MEQLQQLLQIYIYIYIYTLYYFEYIYNSLHVNLLASAYRSCLFPVTLFFPSFYLFCLVPFCTPHLPSISVSANSGKTHHNEDLLMVPCSCEIKHISQIDTRKQNRSPYSTQQVTSRKVSPVTMWRSKKGSDKSHI